MNTIAAYAKDMKDFLNESELTERRAFIKSFVKEIIVVPGDALLRYTIPISQSTTKTSVLVGSGIGRADRERSYFLAASACQTNELALNGLV